MSSRFTTLAAVLTLLLASAVSPLAASTISRYDRASPFSSEIIPHHFPEGLHAPAAAQTRQQLSRQRRRQRRDPSSSQFDFVFTCPDASPALCQSAQAGFERAGGYISSMLTIPNRIKVRASFKSFCSNKTTDECEGRNVLGSAAPAAYFPARPSTAIPEPSSPLSASWFLYPQALVKQLQYDTALDFASYDIVADFNSDVLTWWFQDSPNPIVANQTDFDFVITHELTHGLGWDTSLLSFDQVFDDVASKATPYVAPSIYFHGSPGNRVADAWSFLTAFDALIKDREGRLVTDYMTPVQKWWGTAAPTNGDEPNALTSIIPEFESSGAPFSAAASLSKTIVAAPRSLKINANTTLFTVDDDKNTGFSSGSSITHLDYTAYMNTPDFLMLPYDNDGRGVPFMDLVKRNGGTGAYGPNTLQIMTSMGWGVGGAASAITLHIGKDIKIGDADATSFATPSRRTIGSAGAAAAVAALLGFSTLY